MIYRIEIAEPSHSLQVNPSIMPIVPRTRSTARILWRRQHSDGVYPSASPAKARLPTEFAVRRLRVDRRRARRVYFIRLSTSTPHRRVGIKEAKAFARGRARAPARSRKLEQLKSCSTVCVTYPPHMARMSECVFIWRNVTRLHAGRLAMCSRAEFSAPAFSQVQR